MRNQRILCAVLSIAITIPVLTAAPQPVSRNTTVPVLGAAAFDAHQHVARNTTPRIPYKLNLGDIRQYAYVLSMLRLAGDSPARSPQLFRTLAAAHKSATAGPPVVAELFATENVGTIQPINLIEFFDDDGKNASSSMLSSVPGGTDTTTMAINYRLSTAATPFATSPTFKQMAGGEQFVQGYTVPLAGETPANATVIASSLIITTQGANVQAYTMAVDDATPNATAQCSTAPNYGTWQQPPIPCPAPTASCVNQHPISTPIISCYGRTTDNPPCNYAWGGSGYPPSLTLAIAGQMTFPYPIDRSLSGQYYLDLQRSDGGCMLTNSSGGQTTLPAAYFSISSTNPNVLNYCFSGAQFPNNGCLTTPSASVFVDFSVYVMLDVTGTGSNWGMGKVSSNGLINPQQPWFAQVPTVNVLQGCLAGGTMVTMGDGSEKAIETIDGDGSESAIVNARGETVAVQGIAQGTERHPMVRITDSRGHTLLLSQTHPVVTSRGMVMALRLRTGDTVQTRQGAATITKIEQVPYGEKVWNLTFGPPEHIGEGKSTFFANGILVGDMEMQQRVFAEARRKGFSRAEVLARLPKQWHRDYLNHIAGR